MVFLALSLALLRIQQARLWPQARFQLPTSPLWETLRNDPRPGALFDLPVRMKGIPGYAPGLAQMHHERAVRSYGGVPWLLGPPTRTPGLPITFSLKLDPGQAVPSIRVTDAEVETLRADGFGFIVLQQPQTSTRWFLAAERALTAELGTPLGRDEQVGWSGRFPPTHRSKKQNGRASEIQTDPACRRTGADGYFTDTTTGAETLPAMSTAHTPTRGSGPATYIGRDARAVSASTVSASSGQLASAVGPVMRTTW